VAAKIQFSAYLAHFVHVTGTVFNGMHQRKDQATTGSGRMRVFVGTGMHGLPDAQMEEKVSIVSK
jgi:hypothetical protein